MLAEVAAMPLCDRESQFDLFETPATATERAPRYQLPFQQSQAVDMQRVQRILGVDKCTAIRLTQDRLLRGYQPHRGAAWRVEYSSVVDYCNRLRLEYGIGPRAVPAPGRRLRDEDLLPFPLAETITLQDVCDALDVHRKSVICMIDEGVLVAYQVRLLAPESPWRIYRRSLERHLESLRRAVASPRDIAPRSV